MPLSHLLTSSFYGTRLPGDPRGFFGRVRDARHAHPLRGQDGPRRADSNTEEPDETIAFHEDPSDAVT